MSTPLLPLALRIPFDYGRRIWLGCKRQRNQRLKIDTVMVVPIGDFGPLSRSKEMIELWKLINADVRFQGVKRTRGTLAISRMNFFEKKNSFLQSYLD